MTIGMNETTAKTRALLALMATPGGGWVAIHQILSAAHRLHLPLREFMAVPVGELAARLQESGTPWLDLIARCGVNEKTHADQWLRRAVDAGVAVIPWHAAEYPRRLREDLGRHAPPILFAQGDTSLLERPQAGVVGACRPSAVGRRYAGQCAEMLASDGAAIVSGGARGVDTAAHMAALRAGGATLVVLPQGMFTYRPPVDICNAVMDGKALLISEFLPETSWETHAAVTRNATIAALASLVCVIEPRRAGGSARTGRCALEQGKPVLVCPARDGERAASTLRQTGAIELPRHGPRVDRAALIRIWHTARQRVPEPVDLFRVEG